MFQVNGVENDVPRLFLCSSSGPAKLIATARVRMILVLDDDAKIEWPAQGAAATFLQCQTTLCASLLLLSSDQAGADASRAAGLVKTVTLCLSCLTTPRNMAYAATIRPR